MIEDKGHKIAVQRALDAYNRARGGFADRQTAIMYLLESLERDWEGMRKGSNELPSFVQMTSGAHRMAGQ